MPDIVASWKWRDPGEIIERLVAETALDEHRAEAKAKPKPREQRDRHHVRALQLKRRQSLKKVMKGER
jgi:hypothetical protein